MTDARDLTKTLRGRWHGRYGAAPCPVCQSEGRKGQNALTLADGDSGLLAHCKRTGCDFRAILAAAGIAPGDYRPPDRAELARGAAELRAEAQRRALRASLLWKEAQPIGGTVAERYLREARGITCPLPASLRFHPEAWHGPTASRHPALVALVEGGEAFAVHRTYLRLDGSGKAALDPSKAMLGGTAGGAVRLAKAPARWRWRKASKPPCRSPAGFCAPLRPSGPRYRRRGCVGWPCHRNRGGSPSPPMGMRQAAPPRTRWPNGRTRGAGLCGCYPRPRGATGMTF